MTKIALKYNGYMSEVVAAVGDEEIAALDLDAQTMHFSSWGPTEPITDAGLGPLYRLVEVEVPDWLLAGVKRGQVDGRWNNHTAAHWAARIAGGFYGDGGWAGKLVRLITKKGKFAESLRQYFEEHGMLTDKQALYI